MKQETKEILEWIEKQINLAGTIVTDASQPYWQEDRKKALEFLNSLPEIEDKLCFGGYIQDKNGTLCCHGDKVKIHFHRHDSLIEKYGEHTIGTLSWSNNSKSFGIFLQDKEWVDWKNDDEGVHTFEKIEG